jgi:hypothetical protein
VEKWWRSVNMVQILCTHVCKWKNEACETVPRMGEGEQRRMVEGVNSTMIYSICCKNFCKCHNVYHPEQQWTINKNQSKARQSNVLRGWKRKIRDQKCQLQHLAQDKTHGIKRDKKKNL